MNLNSMIQLLNNNSLDHYLFEITQNDPSIEKKRILHLIQQTMKYYGEGDYHLFSSPARSELIGNHCDHQNGKVIATTINVDMLALVKINPSCSIHLTSLELETIDMDCFDLSFQEHEIHTSQSLIRGIASAMALDNHLPYGFVGCIQSNIPIGSGLSSSAAFEVLIAIIMNHFFYNNQYTPIELAQFCQQSENHYYQKPCGLMDQLSISHGGCISIDFHDPTLPQILPLDFDFKRYGFQLILFDTLNHHAHLSHEYALIPQEMKSVAKKLGNEVLGACKKEDFLLNLPSLNLNNDRSLLRSLHFFNEDERVSQMIHAIQHKSIFKVLTLMKESAHSSHEYLQNVYYETSHQSLNLALAVSETFLERKGITRIHGGGFEGCIQVILPLDEVNKYCENMQKIFPQKSTYLFDVRAKGACLIL